MRWPWADTATTWLLLAGGRGGLYTWCIMADPTATRTLPTALGAESADWMEHAETCPVGVLDRLKFGLVRGVLVGLMHLLGLRGLYVFGKAFGTCEWLINSRMRRRVFNRLKGMLGTEKTDKELSRAVYRFFVRVRCDKILYLILDHIDKQKIIERIEFVGKEHIDEALQRGKGLYIMLSHHGAHHVAALLMALLGYNTAGVRDRKEGAIRRYVQWRYARTFPEFRRLRYFFADGFPRGVYRCFQENFVVGTALDVDRDRGKHLKTVKVDLFGQPQNFLTGTAQIALRCGAPILQGFVVSCEGFRFRLVVREPLADPRKVSDNPDDLMKIMRRYASNIEEHMRRYPCHISKF